MSRTTKSEIERIKNKNKSSPPVIVKPDGKSQGRTMMTFGLGGSILLTITLFKIEAASLVSTGGVFMVFLLFLLLLLSVFITFKGSRLLNLAKDFDFIINYLGNNEVHEIKKLSKSIGRDSSTTLKKLNQMIRRGWFPQGHIDAKNTCFILTNDAYHHYKDAEAALKLRQEEEKQKELLLKDPKTRDLVTIIEEGKAYIQQIRSVNDDISDPVISTKLDHLEFICCKIFDYIETHPKKRSDIRRFMNYYLPTSLKLVQAYSNFDSQPLQGENITQGKTEITKALDQINLAFENLFDQLFQDEMLDISTDISVISTMLSQEGLLEKDFVKEE